MLGVKLTVICVVLTIILMVIASVMYSGYDNITRYRIQNRIKTPKEYNVIVTLMAWFVLLDMVGIMYSTVYLLLFR